MSELGPIYVEAWLERAVTTGAWTKYVVPEAGLYELTPIDTSVQFVQSEDNVAALSATDGKHIPRDRTRQIRVKPGELWFHYYLPAGGKLDVSKVRRYPSDLE